MTATSPRRSPPTAVGPSGDAGSAADTTAAVADGAATGAPRRRDVVADLPAAAAPVDADRATAPATRLFNRELSALAFVDRIVALAEDPHVPLLERARFLAIAGGHLDEFFQIRVAGLKEQLAARVTTRTPDGLSPAATLRHVRTYVEELVARQDEALHRGVLPALAAAGLRCVGWHELGAEDHHHLGAVFEERVFPVLTPLAVDPSRPFPFVSDLSLNLAVVVRDAEDEERFARVKVPPVLPRFVVLPDGARFVPLEQVIAAHLDRLFPGTTIVSHHTFRVTRNADLVLEEEEADDLLLAIESELVRRRFGRVVRLEVEPSMPDDQRQLLRRELELDADDVYVVEPPLDLAGLRALASLDRPDLRFERFTPVTPPELVGHRPDAAAEVVPVLRQGNLLVHHPYESFTASVQAFVEQAAHDPDVLALKITLYRTSGPASPIVRALIAAAEAGKQVVALVELKARFDEQANIGFARTLEEAGVHVVYGLVGLKTHAKVALVVRSEGGGLRRYVHIGSGNYNDATARTFEDLGLLTADEDVGADVSDLFNVLTGYSDRRTYRRLLVAPGGLRHRLLELIRREAEADDGHVALKVNALVDPEMIEALYAASQAGTRVDVLVRGTCCLRPGVPGMSDGIRVRSIVGRYLEHSRIYRFGSPRRGADLFMGSADLMPRNLDRRVEVVVPVTDPALVHRLEEVLELLLHDRELAWELQADGRWQRVGGDGGPDPHARLQELARARARRER